MSDIAQIGIKIDSAGVEAAGKRLDGLTASGGRASAAMKDLAKSSDLTEGRMRQIQTMADRNGVSFKEMEARVRATQPAFNQHANIAERTARANMEAKKATDELAAAVGGGSGAGGFSGALRAAASASGSFGGSLGPLAISLGVVGASIAAVITAARAYIPLMNQMAATSDIGKFTGTSGQNIQGLVSAAGASGIDRSELLANFQKFNDAVVQAKAGIGSLGALFRENNLTVGDTLESFLKLADLVKNTADNKKGIVLSEADIANTRQWVNFLKDGSGAMRAAMESATKVTDVQLDGQRKLEAAYNSMLQKVDDVWKRIVVGAVDGLSRAWTMMTSNNPGDFPGARSPVSITVHPQPTSGSGKSSLDTVAPLLRQNATIALYGDLATAQQKATVAANTLTLAWLQQGLSVGKDRDKILEMHATLVEGAAIQVRAANGIVTADELMQQKKRELAIQVFNQTMTQEQANTSLANYARHARDAADAAEVYASKFPQMTQAILDASRADKQLDQFMTNSVNNTASALTDSIFNWKSLGDTVRNVSLSIGRDLTNMTIKALLFKSVSGFFGGGAAIPAFGTSNGVGVYSANQLNPIDVASQRGGGLVGTGPRVWVHPDYFENAPQMRGGGFIRGDGVPVIAHPNERVLTAEQNKQWERGSGTKIENTFYVFGDVSQETVDRLEKGVVAAHQKADSTAVALKRAQRFQGTGVA